MQHNEICRMTEVLLMNINGRVVLEYIMGTLDRADLDNPNREYM
jgi:hypothetical protein